MAYIVRPVAERFWEKVDRSEECWLWCAGQTRGGYGIFMSQKNQPRRAHRMAWELTYGPIPDGLWVLHRCDNRRCVRPDHLFLGTAKDNVADMITKHRENWSRGECRPNAKLSEADVLAIRAARANGATVKSLSAEYGVTQSTISHVSTGGRWSHIPDARKRPPGAPGQDNGHAKLTEADVRLIRATPSMSAAQLAERFRVSRSTIFRIRSGELWKHIS